MVTLEDQNPYAILHKYYTGNNMQVSCSTTRNLNMVNPIWFLVVLQETLTL